MKFTLTPIAEAVAALVAAAAELNALGAVRPDHAERFTALRTNLDQLGGQVSTAIEAAEALEGAQQSPDAAAFTHLTEEVREMGANVAALVHLANGAKAA